MKKFAGRFLRIAPNNTARVLVWIFAVCLASEPLFAEAVRKPLLTVSSAGVVEGVSPTSDQVTVVRSMDSAAPGIVVTIQPGKEGYPGINVKPVGAAAWDLSAFGHVEARVVNTGGRDLNLSLRVDNAGDWRNNPWNTENISIKPGASAKVIVIFGYAYGHKPSYKLKPGAVTNLLLFAGKSDAVQSFRLEALEAGGAAGEKPPVDPESIRVWPKGGLLLGEGLVIDAAKQISAKGAQASIILEDDRQALQIAFPSAKGEQWATLKPAVGRWNLSDSMEVRVKVRNTGKGPVAPRRAWRAMVGCRIGP